MPAVTHRFETFILASEAPAPVERPGFFRRITDAYVAARTRQAEREIARFIEHQGGRMTDDLERRIERHFI